ncbi:DUF6090 family protein [Robiginitalea aurantiaca]|uniref:DUF6090 family protein n=1 Tax=Robiginitalea aurantiaca TaxID=3056915 RepID=A0ABT7WBH7_9FLAO|nr:DUF6090 family protein [Robiginitalea aurantiaca]MDM9630265.1 DUF6090 family protein [Robiginitalea aurantiaca]
MLRFFRQIRQRLITDNKFSKYLLYAVGEILLVVIGILIAFQVDNWNEQRKIRLEGISLLEDLKSDLEFSRTELEYTINTNQQYLDGYRRIHYYLENDLAYNTELDSAFGNLDVWSIPLFSTTTYETLKTKGIDIIANDSLKQQIIEVHNFNIQSLLDDTGLWEWSFSQNTTQRIMVGNVRRSIDSDIARPNDFERLRTNEEFMNFLSILINIREDHIDYAKMTHSAIKDLIDHIEEELQTNKLE